MAQCASPRKTDAEQMDTISKTADPGKLKDEKKWPDWEPAIMNYLSMIPGVRGVPLLYVVRENDAPDHKTDFGSDFIARSIACAPLDDASFRPDAREVHQLLMNFLVAESAEQWIKDLAPRVNGRRDLEALRSHYGGEGNTSRRITMAEKLHESLHYKSAKSMAGDALKEFITDIGVPDKIVMDGTTDQTGRKPTFMQQVRKHHIDFHLTEPE